MKSAAIDDPFYQSKATLLVEDPLTRRVLVELWQSDLAARQIATRAVGGRDAVMRLVHAARESGHKTVYGLIDRDFGPDWETAKGAVLRTTWHEVENHLLDFETLATCSRKTTATEIEQIALDAAKSQISWMAVRKTLLALKLAIPTFPADPPMQNLQTLAHAKAWLSAQKYVTEVGNELKKWTALHLERTAATIHGELEGDLLNGNWVQTFSGKELWRAIRSKVEWRQTLAHDEDLAFEVARRWNKAGNPPAFFKNIRDAIVQECAL